MHLGRTKMILGTFLLVAVAAALSLSLDFRAAGSNSNTTSHVSKITFGLAGGTAPRPTGTILLYVAGEGDLHPYLERELVRRLEAVAGISGVTVLSSLPDQSASPTLMVQTMPSSLNWTPVYASAGVVTRIVYDSDGDLSWREDTVVEMGRNGGGPQVRVRGDLELEDTTRGVISRPAYHRHLSQQIALAVSNTVKKQLYEKG